MRKQKSVNMGIKWMYFSGDLGLSFRVLCCDFSSVIRFWDSEAKDSSLSIWRWSFEAGEPSDCLCMFAVEREKRECFRERVLWYDRYMKKVYRNGPISVAYA